MIIYFLHWIRAESQRDEALSNLIDSQETLEEYQKKTKDKVKKVCVTDTKNQDGIYHQCFLFCNILSISNGFLSSNLYSLNKLECFYLILNCAFMSLNKFESFIIIFQSILHKTV